MFRALKKGQAIIEFTFSMIVVLLMIFAVMMIFKWTGADLTQRSRSHDETLIAPTARSYTTREQSTSQLGGFIHKPARINAVYGD